MWGVLALAVPFAAQAQAGEECGQNLDGTYCGSEAYFDAPSDTVYGYSFTWDWFDEGVEVYVEAMMWAPDGQYLDQYGLVPFGQMPYPAEETDWTYASVEFAQPEAGPGTWTIIGDHQYLYSEYEDDPIWYDMGGDSGSAYAAWEGNPYEEWTQLASPSSGYFAQFLVSLVPQANWVGDDEEELIGFDDGCFDFYQGPYRAAQPGVRGSWVTGGTFYDDVGFAESADWVNWYNTLILHNVPNRFGQTTSACSWAVLITDTFNGAEYYSRYSGNSVDGHSVSAYRDDVQASTPWPGQ